MGVRASARVVYWFERISEAIAAALCLALMVGLATKAGDRFVLHQPMSTIEDQYAMSWSLDQPTADALELAAAKAH